VDPPTNPLRAVDYVARVAKFLDACAVLKRPCCELVSRHPCAAAIEQLFKNCSLLAAQGIWSVPVEIRDSAGLIVIPYTPVLGDDRAASRLSVSFQELKQGTLRNEDGAPELEEIQRAVCSALGQSVFRDSVKLARFPDAQGAVPTICGWVFLTSQETPLSVGFGVHCWPQPPALTY